MVFIFTVLIKLRRGHRLFAIYFPLKFRGTEFGGWFKFFATGSSISSHQDIRAFIIRFNLLHSSCNECSKEILYISTQVFFWGCSIEGHTQVRSFLKDAS